jgi:hypothetical protein
MPIYVLNKLYQVIYFIKNNILKSYLIKNFKIKFFIKGLPPKPKFL